MEGAVVGERPCRGRRKAEGGFRIDRARVKATRIIGGHGVSNSAAVGPHDRGAQLDAELSGCVRPLLRWSERWFDDLDL